MYKEILEAMFDHVKPKLRGSETANEQRKRSRERRDKTNTERNRP